MNDWGDLSLNVQISEGISEGYIPTDYDIPAYSSTKYTHSNEIYSDKRIFNSFEEAKEWAKNNIGKSFTRYGNNQFIEK